VTFGERAEDAMTAIEQIEIEVRGIKTQLERLADLFEEWLNLEDPHPEVTSFE
jgi:hypothetical protein